MTKQKTAKLDDLLVLSSRDEGESHGYVGL